MKTLAGWGRLPVVEGTERLSPALDAASEGVTLARGLGRSYGDASLPAAPGDRVLGTRFADRILGFDAEHGVLRAEAGLCVQQLNRLMPPRGWTTPVVPGTQYVTLGGMVASDVHGKNHHVAGCFGEHVRALRMRVADGRILEVTEATEPELFRATLGGMGLTGHILEIELQLARIESPWIWSETLQVRDLDTLVGTLREQSRAWPYTVAWADCTARGARMGRGFVTVGRYATREETRPELPSFRERIAVPLEAPSWLVNPISVRTFNAGYYRWMTLRKGPHVTHPQGFFHPLDGVRHWNRLYGRRGFAQYQCVLPLEGDGRAYRRFFDVLTRMGGASPIIVVKDCGAEGKGTLSFPKPGISIAIDVPFRRDKTQALIDALNEVVIDAGGRIYLTKDALTRVEHWLAMEPRLPVFNEIRRKWDPDGCIRSALSVRLLGDSA
jgi:FAD/FMN-containing dehydrogenase